MQRQTSLALLFSLLFLTGLLFAGSLNAFEAAKEKTKIEHELEKEELKEKLENKKDKHLPFQSGNGFGIIASQEFSNKFCSLVLFGCNIVQYKRSFISLFLLFCSLRLHA